MMKSRDSNRSTTPVESSTSNVVRPTVAGQETSAWPRQYVTVFARNFFRWPSSQAEDCSSRSAIVYWLSRTRTVASASAAALIVLPISLLAPASSSAWAAPGSAFQ